MFLHHWWHHITPLSCTFPDLYSATHLFISSASFNIFSWLCDSLIALVIAYAKHFPDHPFCAWLMGTGFVEHFFGLACSLLPDFAYAELLKMKHIMLCQKLLLRGKFDDKRERNSWSGYILDYNASPLTEAELMQAHVTLTIIQIHHLLILATGQLMSFVRISSTCPYQKGGLPLYPLLAPHRRRANPNLKQQKLWTEMWSDFDDWEGDKEDSDDSWGEPEEDEAGIMIAAAHNMAWYSELCKQYNAIVKESQDQPPTVFIGPPLPPTLLPLPASLLVLESELFDSNRKLSISKILDACDCHQSGTTVCSEHVLELNVKFD